MNIDFPDWIPPVGCTADENGFVSRDGWGIFACERDFVPCGYTSGKKGETQLRCMARPGHEHPHVACNMDSLRWANPRMRVDCITRQTGIRVVA